MSVEEIERYNVLADEIRRLGANLEKAKKSRQEDPNAQQRPIGELFLACLQRFDEIDAQYSANCERYDDIHGQLAALADRLGAIEAGMTRIHQDYLDAIARLNVIEGCLTQEWSKAIRKRASKLQRRQRRSKR